MLNLIENIGGFVLGLLIIACVGAVIAIPFYGLYRVLSFCLNNLKGLVIVKYICWFIGIAASIASIAYFLPSQDYMDCLIFLVIAFFALNWYLILAQQCNLAIFTLRSRFHLVNSFIAAVISLGVFVYIFTVSIMDESIWKAKAPLAILLGAAISLRLVFWLKNVIYFWYAGVLTDDFFRLNPKIVVWKEKQLYPILMPESLVNENVEERVDIAIRNAALDEAGAIEKFTVLNITPDKAGVIFNESYILTSRQIMLDETISEDVSPFLLQKSSYAEIEIPTSSIELRNYVMTLYIWLAITRAMPIRKLQMFVSWPADQEKVRIYSSVRSIYSLSL